MTPIPYRFRPLLLLAICATPLAVACNTTTDPGGADTAIGDSSDGDAGDDGSLDAARDGDAEADSSVVDAALDADVDAAAICTSETTHVYLIGDSTTASGSGWGDFLTDYLSGGATVINAAASGRSSKSFYEEGRFAPVREALTDADYVLIQFGHNDSKPDVERHTEPGTSPDYDGTFRENLERYIGEVRAAGATPILLTPVSRMSFSSSGALSRTHGEYAPAVRAVAATNGVTLLDLEEESYQTFDALGEAATLEMYAGYDDNPDDRTHFPPEKAHRVAEMVVVLLTASESPLACFVD